MPELVTLSEKLIVGISTRTRNELEAAADTSTNTSLWSRFWGENVGEKIPNALPEPVLYGLYTEYESDHNVDYTLVVGMAASDASDLPDSMKAVRTKAGKYLLFKREGKMPDVVFRTWQEVWTYFEENDDVQRAYTTDFEEYVDQSGVSIYIALKD